MAALAFAPAALADLERLVDFLRDTDPPAAASTAAVIFNGLRVLQEHPLIGRPLGRNRRELVIHRGRTGYLAQYHHEFKKDEVIVLAIRPQRELDD